MMTMLEGGYERIESGFARLNPPTGVDGARWFGHLTGAALGMTGLTIGMLLLDDRTLGGEPAWLKPFKFAVSFALLFATFGFACRRLSAPVRTGALVVATAAASAAAFLFEMAYIGTQAARLEPSHFNESTPYHESMYGLMGVGASALMASIGIVGIAALVDRQARLGPALRLAVGLGFLLSAVLTTWVAGELAGNGGRHVGTPTIGGPTIPVLGWSMEVGDLRPAHFLSLHAMQLLPVLGWLADRRGSSSRLIWIAAALYASLVVLVFHQARLGLPLISL